MCVYESVVCNNVYFIIEYLVTDTQVFNSRPVNWLKSLIR